MQLNRIQIVYIYVSLNKTKRLKNKIELKERKHHHHHHYYRAQRTLKQIHQADSPIHTQSNGSENSFYVPSTFSFYFRSHTVLAAAVAATFFPIFIQQPQYFPIKRRKLTQILPSQLGWEHNCIFHSSCARFAYISNRTRRTSFLGYLLSCCFCCASCIFANAFDFVSPFINWFSSSHRHHPI